MNTALNKKYFFDHLSMVVDYYSRKFDRFVIMGDFNSEPSDEQVESSVPAIIYIT